MKPTITFHGLLRTNTKNIKRYLVIRIEAESSFIAKYVNNNTPLLFLSVCVHEIL